MLGGVLLSAVLLLGCGVAQPAAKGEADVKICVVCSAGDLKWKSGMEDVADAFMKENEHIQVELNFLPEIKNQTYVERLKVLAAENEFYDVLELRETDTMAEAGLLAPLPEEVYSLTDRPRIDNGSCFGVPRFTTTLGIIYNQELFDKLGLSKPKDYEEFLELCGKLKNAGYDPLAIGSADIWHMKFWGNYLFRNYIMAADGSADWSAERVEPMLKCFRDLTIRGYIDTRYRNVSDSQTAQEVSTGRAAMVYTGPWMLSQIENLNQQIQLGFFFLPGNDGTAYAMEDRNVEWGISAKTVADEAKMAAAVKFLQFYYSEGVYETILEIMNADPVTVRPIHMPDTRNQQIMEAAYSDHPTQTSVLVENAGASDGFVAYYEQTLQEALWGRESIASLAEKLAEKWEEP